jgi:hypothetical protein
MPWGRAGVQLLRGMGQSCLSAAILARERASAGVGLSTTATTVVYS